MAPPTYTLRSPHVFPEEDPSRGPRESQVAEDLSLTGPGGVGRTSQDREKLETNIPTTKSH